MTEKILLASGSPRRKELLEIAGVQFEVVKSDFEEIIPDNCPLEEIPMLLAEGKAEAVALQYPDSKIIAADTIVLIDEEVLGKPQDKTDAIRMLQLLSNNTHKVITGVCLMQGEETYSFSVETDVSFKALSELEINYYIDTYQPFDKAGAYGIQEWIGLIGITEIHGDYYNVVGLPVSSLLQEAERIGWKLM